MKLRDYAGQLDPFKPLVLNGAHFIDEIAIQMSPSRAGGDLVVRRTYEKIDEMFRTRIETEQLKLGEEPWILWRRAMQGAE